MGDELKKSNTSLVCINSELIWNLLNYYVFDWLFDKKIRVYLKRKFHIYIKKLNIKNLVKCLDLPIYKNKSLFLEYICVCVNFLNV